MKSPIIGDLHKGLTVRKMHAKLLQSVGETPENLSQKPMQKIFFPKYKSPQKLMSYGGSLSVIELVTPYGSREF